MNKNQISHRGAGFTFATLIIAIVALCAFAIPQASAAQFQYLQFTNSSLGTAYAPQGGTNYNTVTNGQARYVPTGSPGRDITAFQNLPLMLQAAIHSQNTGTSNTVLGLDLSPDNVYWVSNAVTITVAQTGTTTNFTLQYYPLLNGTNIFSNYHYARWGYAGTAQLTNVIVDQFQLIGLK